jgi:hypothetical protein
MTDDRQLGKGAAIQIPLGGENQPAGLPCLLESREQRRQRAYDAQHGMVRLPGRDVDRLRS